jgi:hypothetical protein
MESANNVYAVLGKDKKSPGQWLALKTTKAFMKATKSKYKKEDDVYLMDDDLLKEYECYLKGQQQKIKTEAILVQTLKDAIGEKLTHVFLDLFIQRVAGLSFSKINQVYKKSKGEFIDEMHPMLKHTYEICSRFMIVEKQLHKIITESDVKDCLSRNMRYCESQNCRAVYPYILDNDNVHITYAKIKEK